LRILFDKNVPYPLLDYLAEYDVCTAEEQGWARLVNGDLLRVAEDSGFDVMVTADQNLEYQQNLKGRKLALVVLSTNHIGTLKKYPEKLMKAVEAAREGTYEFVKYDLPPRRNTDRRETSEQG
jgi:hypothetical protein